MCASNLIYKQNFLITCTNSRTRFVTNSMYRSGLVNILVTHANMKEFGLASLSGACCGYMPPQLKTKQKNMWTNLPVWEIKRYPRLNLSKNLPAKFSSILITKENLLLNNAFTIDISAKSRSSQLIQMFAI